MRTNKKIGIAVLFIFILISSLFFFRKFIVMKQINFIIEDCINLIENSEQQKIIKYISPEYSDAYGNTFETLNNDAGKLKFIDSAKIRIVKKKFSELNNSEAQLSLSVLINFKIKELGKLDAFEEFTLYFHKYGDNWSVRKFEKNEKRN